MSSARLAASLMFFANGCAFATWASRIPSVQQQLQLSPSVIGVALLMMGLGALAAMQFVARVIQRAGSNRVTSLACLLTAASLFAVSMAANVYQLSVMLFVFGFFSGAMDVSMNANAVTVERLEKRPIMASFHALWSIGSMVGALAGGALAHAGWNLFTHFAAVSFVVALFGAIAFKWLVKEGVVAEAGSAEVKDSAPQIAEATRDDTIALLAFVCLLAFVSEGAIADWSALYMSSTLHTDMGLATLGLASFSGAMTIGRLVGDRFIEKYGDVKVLAVGSITTLIAILIATVPSLWICALLGFFLAGIGLSVQVPITFRVSGRSRPDNPGAAIAIVARAGYLGLLLGPPIMGFIADAAGLRLSLLALACLPVLTLICSVRLNKDP